MRLRRDLQQLQLESFMTAVDTRYYFTDQDDQSHYQLHIFSDASTKSYVAVAFICNESSTCFVQG